MIYDYDDQEGYVSIWIGNCTDYSVLEEYISTVYLDEEEDFDDGLHPPKRLEKVFLPSNRDRACEEELRESFNNEFYNQFEYASSNSCMILNTKAVSRRRSMKGFICTFWDMQDMI